MKSNINIIITAIIAVLIGLTGGYFLFANKTINPAASPSTHQHAEAPAAPATPGEEEIWTCSMHPQVRQNEFGLCPICEMDLILLEANTSDDPLVLQMTNAAVQLANIQTSTIGGKVFSKAAMDEIRLSGKVQTDERLAASLVAHIPGRIEKLYVSFTGEQVREGQQLADIYAPDLITAQRELIEAVKLQSISPGLLEAARNKLRYWKIGETMIANIEQSGRIQETFTIYAESSGIVTNRRVAVGDYVQQGRALFDVMNIGKLWVVFDAYEEHLATIRVGDQIAFTTAAIPNKTFKTKVTFIDPLINPSTRVASIRTEINNSAGLLKPEMFVEGMLRKRTATGNTSNLSVPKSAVLWTGIRSVVYVKIPDTEIPSFQYREIEIGQAQGNAYQIVNGLEAGEEVVTNGSFSIDAAAQLNNQASMMNKNVSLKKEGEEAIPNFQADTPDTFKEQLNQLVNTYIQMKNAFVKTDATSASKASEKFILQLEQTDMTLLKGEAHQFWMELLSGMNAHAQKIGQLSDVEDQRVQFGFISDLLIDAVEAFGTKGNALYVQHCPMAFDNEGADWLASEEAIQNPYFGDKMMKCGLVKKTF